MTWHEVHEATVDCLLEVKRVLGRSSILLLVQHIVHLVEELLYELRIFVADLT